MSRTSGDEPKAIRLALAAFNFSPPAAGAQLYPKPVRVLVGYAAAA
jgi:hypothetical protein